MNKVILLEDRKKRQDNLLENIPIDLDSYSDIFENINGSEFTRIIDNFESFLSNLTKDDVIIAHESALKSKDLIDTLKEACKNKELKLVLFSGGINITSYSNLDFELLYLNSKEFYSNNLKLFLDSGKDSGEFNLLKLAYGANWEINLLFNYIEKANIFISGLYDEKILYEEFLSRTNLASIRNFINFTEPQLSNGWVSTENLKKFCLELNNIIKSKVSDAL